MRLSHLSVAEKRAYVLADNKIALNAGWDSELLAIELGELADLLPEIDLGLEVTGYETGEIEIKITMDAISIAKCLGVAVDRISCDHLSFEAKFQHRKRGVETRLILADTPGTRDDTPFRNIALAHRYFEMIRSGKTYTEIAEVEGTSKRRIQQRVELAFLAPDILRKVWEGEQPMGLTSEWLNSHSLPHMWTEQRALINTL